MMDRHDHRAFFLALARLQTPPLLVPKLRRLVWSSDRDLFPATRLFVGPNLVFLDLGLSFMADEESFKCLSSLGAACPHLKILRAHDSKVLNRSTNLISKFICGLHKLEDLSCPRIPLSDSAFSHLARLASLRRLDINLTHIREPRRPCKYPFLNVQAFSVTHVDLDYARAILEYMKSAPEEVHIKPQHKVVFPAWTDQFFVTVSERFDNSTVQSVIFDDEMSWAAQDGPLRRHNDCAITIATMRRLFCLNHLRVLKLGMIGALDVDNHDLKEMAVAWPHMEEFAFRGGRCTCEGLISLLRHCPKLRHLTVLFGVSNFNAALESPVVHDLRNNAITHLHFAHGRNMEEGRASDARKLFRIVPGLRNVTVWGQDPEEKLQDESLWAGIREECRKNRTRSFPTAGNGQDIRGAEGRGRCGGSQRSGKLMAGSATAERQAGE
ncbi:hypothetical protein BV22DRAFT_289808 [Leucogyrophana mollusca]|uniref:Uncharacterized protein n=1 Tax=Leucogyrophana mollusca TaxID=85980 RepID=A0ACB8BNV4_9AGAM|nr:hypothetical protein BV22DRAFT_289808 [Leucogyrophana mollusca]